MLRQTEMRIAGPGLLGTQPIHHKVNNIYSWRPLERSISRMFPGWSAGACPSTKCWANCRQSLAWQTNNVVSFVNTLSALEVASVAWLPPQACYGTPQHIPTCLPKSHSVAIWLTLVLRSGWVELGSLLRRLERVGDSHLPLSQFNPPSHLLLSQSHFPLLFHPSLPCSWLYLALSLSIYLSVPLHTSHECTQSIVILLLFLKKKIYIYI